MEATAQVSCSDCPLPHDAGGNIRGEELFQAADGDTATEQPVTATASSNLAATGARGGDGFGAEAGARRPAAAGSMLLLESVAREAQNFLGGGIMVLPSADATKICFVLEANGIKALGLNTKHNEQEIMYITELHEDDLPTMFYLHDEDQWVDKNNNSLRVRAVGATTSPAGKMTVRTARTIVKAVNEFVRAAEPEYLRKEIVMPTNSCLCCNNYILEMLEHAMHHQASHTSLTIRSASSPSASKHGLLMMHNGVNFTVADVLSLSSLRLHTKISSIVRTLDPSLFHDRFGSVIIYDDVYAVKCNGVFSDSDRAFLDWLETEDIVPPEDRMWDRRQDSSTRSWSHFQLERPVLEQQSLVEDVERLPSCLPSIFTVEVGRSKRLQALPSLNLQFINTAKRYKLDLGDWRFVASSESYVSQDPNDRGSGNSLCWETVRVRKLPRHRTAHRSEVINTFWIFVGHCVFGAADSTDNFTSGRAECRLFFEVDEHMRPVVQQLRGEVFVGLRSTKIILPMQANMLLLSRAYNGCCLHVEAEHPTHQLKQLSCLCLDLLLWNVQVASSQPITFRSQLFISVFQLLPAMKLRADMTDEVHSVIRARQKCLSEMEVDAHHVENKNVAGEPILTAPLGENEDITMSSLVFGIYHCAVVPFVCPVNQDFSVGFEGSSASNAVTLESVDPSTISLMLLQSPLDLRYTIASNTIWLPPAFSAAIHPLVLSSWLGLQVFPSCVLSEACVQHPLWTFLPRLTVQRLRKRAAYFFHINEAVERACEHPSLFRGCMLTIKMLAVLAEVWSAEWPPTEQYTDQPSRGHETASCGHFEHYNLPHLLLWPILPTDYSYVTDAQDRSDNPSEIAYCSASRMAWFNRLELDNIPATFLQFLRPFMIKALRQAREPGRADNERDAAEICLPTEEFISLLVEGAEAFKPRLGSAVSTESCKLAYSIYICAREYEKALVVIDGITAMLPNQVVPLQSCINLFMQHLYETHFELHKTSVILEAVLCFFSWSITHAMPEATRFVLVDSTSADEPLDHRYRLEPAYQTFLGTAYCPQRSLQAAFPPEDNKRVEELISGGFVSSAYIEYMSTKNPSSLPDEKSHLLSQLSHFLQLCGVQCNISLEATSHYLTTDAEIAELPSGQLPLLRSSTTSNVLTLPYNLGSLTRRDVVVVDADLTDIWKSVFAHAINNWRLACYLGEMVSNLLKLKDDAPKGCYCHLDVAENASAQTTPSAAAVLRGRTANDPFELAELLRLSIRNRLENQGHLLPFNSPYPVAKRVFYLPPHQPGASAVSMRAPAAWLRALSTASWVPAYASGYHYRRRATNRSYTKGDLVILSPSQVFLPGLTAHKQVRSLSMPVVALEDNIVSNYISAPDLVLQALAWGTVKPKPPIQQLQQLLVAINNSSTEESIDQYDDLRLIWDCFSAFAADGDLTDEHILSIRDSCSTVSGVPAGACILSIPAPDGTIRKIEDCFLPDITSTKAETLEELAALSMCELGLLVDLSSRDSVRGIDRVYGDLKDTGTTGIFVGELLGIGGKATIRQADRFMKECTDSSVFAASAMSEARKASFSTAFSCCLWMVVRQAAQTVLGKDLTLAEALSFVEIMNSTTKARSVVAINPHFSSSTCGQFSATTVITTRTAINRILLSLKADYPLLSVFCRVPSICGLSGPLSSKGTEELPELFSSLMPSQWVRLFAANPFTLPSTGMQTSVIYGDAETKNKCNGAFAAGTVIPVHIPSPVTEETSRLLQILRPRHGIHVLEVLNHCLQRDKATTSAILADADAALLNILNIKSLSSAHGFGLQVLAEGDPVPLHAETMRLTLVVRLLLVAKMVFSHSTFPCAVRSTENCSNMWMGPNLLSFRRLAQHVTILGSQVNIFLDFVVIYEPLTCI
jgi:hypothetical protein